ncbi:MULTISPECIES: Na(+)/H(+) antiporter subunit C [unclassified Actinotalea]|uniref:Na(+)/H(+) antiporter subunit C n=1 Tax=unclassified Actinotalea TaxID=2638618 RepID=UPI0015F3F0A4|nr:MULTISPECIES: Na(+)/H(+) antiporter subunit C [unclassified Actinotalea]
MIEMSPSLALVATIVVLVTVGVYLLLERSLTRVLLGVIILGNGVNLLFLVAGGRAGGAPIIGLTPEGEMSDPLPQAMVLTAIVITLGMTAFLLAMAYRSWQLNRHDEVQDDLEDRRIARRAAADQAAYADADADVTTTLDEDAESVRDETGPVDQGIDGDGAPMHATLDEAASGRRDRGGDA